MHLLRQSSKNLIKWFFVDISGIKCSRNRQNQAALWRHQCSLFLKKKIIQWKYLLVLHHCYLQHKDKIIGFFQLLHIQMNSVKLQNFNEKLVRNIKILHPAWPKSKLQYPTLFGKVDALTNSSNIVEQSCLNQSSVKDGWF